MSIRRSAAPIGEKAMTGAERMTQAARHSPSAYANGLGHYFPHYSTTFPLLLLKARSA